MCFNTPRMSTCRVWQLHSYWFDSLLKYHSTNSTNISLIQRWSAQWVITEGWTRHLSVLLSSVVNVIEPFTFFKTYMPPFDEIYIGKLLIKYRYLKKTWLNGRLKTNAKWGNCHMLVAVLSEYPLCRYHITTISMHWNLPRKHEGGVNAKTVPSTMMSDTAAVYRDVQRSIKS